MSAPELVAVGKDGASLRLSGDILSIHRSKNKLMSGHMRGTKEIRVSQISAVQFRAAKGMQFGYIQISFLGGAETKRRSINAVKTDENAVTFTRRTQPQFAKLKRALDEMMANYRAGAVNGLPASQPRQMDKVTKLRELATLRDDGVVTEDEYAKLKAEVIGG